VDLVGSCSLAILQVTGSTVKLLGHSKSTSEREEEWTN